jgi:glycine C-acetyltransferase
VLQHELLIQRILCNPPCHSCHPGGYTTGRGDVIDILRQKSRPYLFSNTLAPAVAAASLTVFDLLTSSSSLLKQLHDNTAYFRKAITEAGFTIKPGTHPIVVSGGY